MTKVDLSGRMSAALDMLSDHVDLTKRVSISVVDLSVRIAELESEIQKASKNIVRAKREMDEFESHLSDDIRARIETLCAQVQQITKKQIRQATESIDQQASNIARDLREVRRRIEERMAIIAKAGQATQKLSNSINEIAEKKLGSYINTIDELKEELTRELTDYKDILLEPLTSALSSAGDCVSEELLGLTEGAANELKNGIDDRVAALVSAARESLAELLGDFETVEEQILDAAGISEAETAALEQLRVALEEVFAVFESAFEQLGAVA